MVLAGDNDANASNSFCVGKAEARVCIVLMFTGSSCCNDIRSSGMVYVVIGVVYGVE